MYENQIIREKIIFAQICVKCCFFAKFQNEILNGWGAMFFNASMWRVWGFILFDFYTINSDH